MTHAENKIFQLFDVLEYQRKYKPSFLSTGERILIHQERAAWYEVRRQQEEGNEDVKPRYRVPQRIQKKIDEIIYWLRINKRNQ